MKKHSRVTKMRIAKRVTAAIMSYRKGRRPARTSTKWLRPAAKLGSVMAKDHNMPKGYKLAGMAARAAMRFGFRCVARRFGGDIRTA